MAASQQEKENMASVHNHQEINSTTTVTIEEYPGLQTFEILHDKPPEDYLCLSIWALLFCFPIGIIALIFSLQTKHSNRWNERALAADTSHQAFYIAVLGIVMGSLITLVILILLMMDLFTR